MKNHIGLTIIREENSDGDESPDEFGHRQLKKLGKKAHAALKSFVIGPRKRNQFFLSPVKLNSLLEDLEAIKTGNYEVVY